MVRPGLVLLLVACSSSKETPDAGGVVLPDAPPLTHPDAAPPDAPPGPDALPPAPTDRIITTVGGYGIHDGKIGQGAWMGTPQALQLAADGSILFYDGSYNAIRRIDADDVITTIAGSWREGYAGDGGDATAAQLAGKYGGEFTIGPDGLYYLTDFSNQRVRVVNATAGSKTACGGVQVGAGKIETIAGTGDNGFAGEGVPALEAHLAYPRGITFWRGDLVFNDIHSCRTRRITCATGIIDTIAGNGSCPFIDATGVIEVRQPDGTLSPIADFGDGGDATAASVPFPSAIAVDPAGALLVAEWGFNDSLGDYGRIRRVTTDGKITTVVGSTEANGGDSDDPLMAGFGGNIKGMVFDDQGRMFVADAAGRIRRVEAGYGKVTKVIGDIYGYSSDDVNHPAIEGHLSQGTAVLFKGSRLYFADANNGWLRWLDPGADGIGPDSSVGDLSSGDGPMQPWAFAIDSGGHIFTLPNGDGRILELDRKTNTFSTLANQANVFAADVPGDLPAAQRHMNALVGLAFDEHDNLYGSDGIANQIIRIDAVMETGDAAPRVHPDSPSRRLADFPGIGFLDHLAAGGGYVYVGDGALGDIYQIAIADGTVTHLAGNGLQDGSGVGAPAAQAGIVAPEGVAVDVANHALYVADGGLGRVWRLDLAGGDTKAIDVVSAFPDDCPQCTNAHQVTFGHGFLFVGDIDFQRVLRIDLSAFDDPSVEQKTILGPVGDGAPGFNGDQIPGAAVVNLDPRSITIGPDGFLYIDSMFINRIRRLGTVDIVPGDGENHIDVSPSVTTPIEVAFLSSYAFDATKIDPTSINVGGAHALAGSASQRDVDGDGRADLVVKVLAPEMAVQIGDREVGVTARTTDGTTIHDSDYVVVTADAFRTPR